MLLRVGTVGIDILPELECPTKIVEVETFLRIRPNKVYREIDGYKVKMSSSRYPVFQRSLCCVKCGLMGEFFAIERHHKDGGETYHLNLYAIKDGLEVLMTKDHITSKKNGGRDCQDNYQTMCLPCNMDKGTENKKY